MTKVIFSRRELAALTAALLLTGALAAWGTITLLDAYMLDDDHIVTGSPGAQDD